MEDFFKEKLFKSVRLFEPMVSHVPRRNVTMLLYFAAGLAIGCFKCSSVNGRYPACEDPFHNNVSGMCSFLLFDGVFTTKGIMFC